MMDNTESIKRACLTRSKQNAWFRLFSVLQECRHVFHMEIQFF
jgi:hypothetical protein